MLQGAPARTGAAEFPTIGIAPTALSLRLRSGKSDRSICHWQIAQTVLWLPTFKGGVGRLQQKGRSGCPGGPITRQGRPLGRSQADHGKVNAAFP